MNFKDLDEHIHDIEDLHKKYAHTIVYGSTASDPTPKAYYIESLGARVECKASWDDTLKLVDFSNFNLLEERPQACIVNGKYRPFMVVPKPLRQWKRGMHRENTAFVDLRGRWYNPDDKQLDEIGLFYKPQYFSFSEAVGMLQLESKKHVAIDKDTTIMKACDRFVLFKRFTPALTYENGMLFKVNPVNGLLKREVEYYEYLFKTAL